MSRYVSRSSTAPRSLSVMRTVSDPAVAIPAWAKVMWITGVGPGGGGGNNSLSRGAGGGAAGYANRVPIALAGEATCAIVIGAPGVGAVGNSSLYGAAGGTSTVTVGVQVLTLAGGKGGGGGTSTAADIAGDGGLAHRGASAQLAGIDRQQERFAPFTPLFGTSGFAPSDFLRQGASGGRSNLVGGQAEGLGAGAFSPFGAGGAGIPASVANAPGGNASGHGAGGAGSNAAGKAGDGAPGYFLIDFSEAA